MLSPSRIGLARLLDHAHQLGVAEHVARDVERGQQRHAAASSVASVREKRAQRDHSGQRADDRRRRARSRSQRLAALGRGAPAPKAVDRAGHDGDQQPPVVGEQRADEDQQPRVPGQRLARSPRRSRSPWARPRSSSARPRTSADQHHERRVGERARRPCSCSVACDSRTSARRAEHRVERARASPAATMFTYRSPKILGCALQRVVEGDALVDLVARWSARCAARPSRSARSARRAPRPAGRPP